MKITVMQNGPYLVETSNASLTKDGIEEKIDGKMIALCRCAHSTNKPLCDGKHKHGGFESEAAEVKIN